MYLGHSNKLQNYAKQTKNKNDVLANLISEITKFNYTREYKSYLPIRVENVAGDN